MAPEDDTRVTLKEYTDARFEALSNAIQNTATQLDKRLDGMNEFRQQINDLTRQFVTRQEHDLLVNRVNSNENKISNFEGRSYAVGVVVTIISLAASIALHFIK